MHMQQILRLLQKEHKNEKNENILTVVLNTNVPVDQYAEITIVCKIGMKHTLLFLSYYYLNPQQLIPQGKRKL